MKNQKTTSGLLGKRLALSLSEPHQYGKLGTYEAIVIAAIQDKNDNEMYLLKPLHSPLIVLDKFTARLLAIGPTGGYKKEDRPVMPKLLQNEHIQVVVNFLEDDNFYHGQLEVKREDFLNPKSVKFGCYAEVSLSKEK